MNEMKYFTPGNFFERKEGSCSFYGENDIYLYCLFLELLTLLIRSMTVALGMMGWGALRYTRKTLRPALFHTTTPQESFNAP